MFRLQVKRFTRDTFGSPGRLGADPVVAEKFAIVFGSRVNSAHRSELAGPSVEIESGEQTATQ